MDFMKMVKRFEKLTIDNSPALLTAIGITGTLTTAYLTGKATIKATRLYDEEMLRTSRFDQPDPAAKDVVKLVWKFYIPPAVTGVFTIAAIAGANHINGRRATAMATAYSLSERAFTEYKDKIVERVGKTKEQGYRDELAQERVTRNPVNDSTVIITDGGEVLCYDQYTGRYFKSSMEALKSAENAVNYTILHRDYASLSDFYDELGLPSTGVSDEVGWNTDQLLELEISTVMSNDNRPCIAINFNHRPIRNFDQYAC